MRRNHPISILIFLCWFVSTVTAKEVLISTDTIQLQSKDNYYIISIGINQYQDDFWPELKWPANDAEKISQLFGRNTQFNVKKLTLINQNATLNNIQQKLVQIAHNITFDDTVILYFSGHGTLARNDQGELSRVAVLHDTDNTSLIKTGLTHRWLRRWQDTLKAKKKMMIFATCNSGVGKSRIPLSIRDLLATQKGNLIPLEEVSEGALILAAAAKGEAAREDDTLQGDIYTHYLLEALSIYDRNHDGMVSALEAHDYAREKTWAFTRGKQRPTADVKLIGNADIPLQGKKLRAAIPVLEAYDEELAGFQIQVDNGVKGRLPLAFALQPSGSVVRLFSPENGRQLAKYQVKLGAGDTMPLDQVINHRPIGFGIEYQSYQWRDDAWKRVSGDDVNRELIGKLSWHYRKIGIGLAYPLQLTSYENEIRPTLDTAVTLFDPYLFTQFKTRWKRFVIGVEAQLGYETLNIKFTDNVSKQRLDFTDSNTSYGAIAFAGYEILPDFNLNITIGYKKTDWKFGTIGNINGERISTGLSLQYQFDWRVRRL